MVVECFAKLVDRTNFDWNLCVQNDSTFSSGVYHFETFG